MAPTKNEKYGDKLLYFDDLSDVWDEYQSIERSNAEGRTMSRAIEDEMDAMVTRLGLSNGWLAIVGNKIVDAHGSEKYAYDNYDNKRTGSDGNANNGQPKAGSSAGSMKLETPKNWDTESLNKVTGPADAKLGELVKTTPNEVGYLLRYNEKTNELFADFFIGQSSIKWINMKVNPYDHDINKDEKIIGFTHTHPDDIPMGPDDQNTNQYMTFGGLKWTNIPAYPTNGKASGGFWNKMLSLWDKMYFKVLHGGGFDAYSWNLMSLKDINTLIHTINACGFYGNPSWIPKSEGIDYIKRKK